MKEQKVIVKGSVNVEEVYDIVSKTGKKIAFWVEPENKPTKTVATTQIVSVNKPPEHAIVLSSELEIKPSKIATIFSIEPDNKPSETATIIA
ncbi:hypothetical protein RYX36_019889 [Vicia faba]